MNLLLKLKPLILSAAGIFMFCSGVRAQQSNAFAPSPDSKSLIRSVQNPVNYYTGVVNIQAPIYTVAANGVTVPISLSYQSSGIKISDKATSVGLGWRLSSGGKITRMVRQFPDEQIQRYVCSTNTNSNSTFAKNASWLDWPFENVKGVDSVNFHRDHKCCYNNYGGYSINKYDTEPDIFYYEVPGSSGMFVLDHNKNAYPIPYQDVSIQFLGDYKGNKSYFIIKDNTGNTYRFGTQEASRETIETTRYYKSGDRTFTYISTWLLDDITPLIGEKVGFTYVSGEHVPSVEEKNMFQVGVYAKEGDVFKQQGMWFNKASTSVVSPKYLKKITWSGGRVEFSYQKRTALNKKQHEVLSNIKVISCQFKEVNDIYFDYSFFRNGETKLEAIREKFGEHMQYLYKFKYNASQHIPDNGEPYYDHWGYYNGSSQYSDYMPAINDGTVKIFGHSRQPVEHYTRANILTSVETANGTSTEYKYELNDIYENSLYPSQPFGGLRIAAIEQTYPNEKRSTVMSYSYEKEPGVSSGKAFQRIFQYYDVSDSDYYVYSQCLNNIFDFGGNHISYAKVTEHYPDGSYVVYNFDENIASNDPDWSPQNDIYPAYTGSNAFRMKLLAPSTSYFWRRGLLTSQETYDASKKLVAKTENQYTFGTPKKVIECYVPYTTNYNNKWTQIYRWVSEPVFLAKTITHLGRHNSRSETIYEYNTNRMIPTKIVNVDGDNNRYETRVRYSGDYRTSNAYSSSLVCMISALKYMQLNNAYAVPIETINYKNGKIVGGAINYYRGIATPVKTTGIVPDKALKLVLPSGITTIQFMASDIYTQSLSSEFRYDSRYEVTDYYDEYMGNGVLISSHKKNGLPKSVIYGYNNTLPVAMVENAVCSANPKKNQVYYDSFESGSGILALPTAKSGDYVLSGYREIKLKEILADGEYVLSYWTRSVDSFNRTGWTYVEKAIKVNSMTPNYVMPSLLCDELRIMPKGASMTTYTYQPGVGKTSETDMNGRSIYYEYNKFKMLKVIRDNEDMVIKRMTYDNYTND